VGVSHNNTQKQPITWVKDEMARIAQLCHDALENYGKDLNSIDLLVPLAEQLNQLRGAFYILNFRGVALLVDDMGYTLRSIISHKIKKPEEAYSALISATLNLQDYIHHMDQLEQMDTYQLLGAINELRASRDEPLVTESSFFNPDLSIVPRALPLPTKADIPADLVQGAKQLRPYYQAALLSWYRDPDDKLGLTQMRRVIAHLEALSQSPRARQLWWIAGGLLDALNDSTLNSNVSLRLLLGQLDREIKLLIVQGNQVLESNPPIQLLKNFLFYIAQSGSKSERVSALNSVYKLRQLLPANSSDIKYQSRPDTLKCVAKELNTTLQKVKTVIDSFERNPNKSTNSLKKTITPLKHIADTLGLIGMGDKRKLLIEQIIKIQNILKNNFDKNTMISIASNLLHIETSLQHVDREIMNDKLTISAEKAKRTSAGDGNLRGHRLPESEVKQLEKHLIDECRSNINQVKNNILAFLTNRIKSKSLGSTPSLLDQVNACLLLINQTAASHLLQCSAQCIEEKILGNESNLKKPELDLVAETIVGIEYFLEALADEGPQAQQALQITERSLKKLGYDPKAVLQASIDNEALEYERLPQTKHENKLADDNDDADKIRAEPDVKIENNIVELPIEDLEKEVAKIFLEEATEELEVIAIHLGTLQTSGYNEHALSNLRKSFHTLKGSGDIAGAKAISRFATCCDDFIRDLLCGAIRYNEETGHLLIRAYTVLADLIPRFRENDIVPEAVEQLITLLSQYATQHHDADADKNVATTLIDDDDFTAESSLVDAQATIQRFVEGALTEIEHILNYIITQKQKPELEPLPQAIAISVKELHIKAMASGIEEFLQTTELLEQYTDNLYSNQNNISNDTLDILDEFCVTTRDLLNSLNNNPNSHLTDSSKANNNAAELLAQVEVEISTAEAVATKPDIDETFEPANDIYTQTSVKQNTASDPIDEELLEIFVEEATEITDQLASLMGQWDDTGETDFGHIQRLLHTLKGSARMANIHAIGNLTHALENLILSVDSQQQSTAGFKQLTQEVCDRIIEMVYACKNQQSIVDDNNLLQVVNRFEQQLHQDSQAMSDMHTQAGNAHKQPAEALTEKTDSILDEVVIVDLTLEQPQTLDTAAPVLKCDHVAPDETKDDFEKSQASLDADKHNPNNTPPTSEVIDETLVKESSPVAASKQTDSDHKRTISDSVRINADVLDGLVDRASEANAIHNRQEDQLSLVKDNLLELDKTISRLKDQLRDLEFEHHHDHQQNRPNAKPNQLELDRFSNNQETAKRLAESIDDISNLHGTITRLTLEMDNLATQQQRIHSELYDSLLGTRMITFSNQTQRLQRIVRQTCRELGKKAELSIEGTEGSLDRHLLEKLMGPLEHILRNAIVHGIETPKERVDAGKPEVGKIKIKLIKERTENLLLIEDDGNGINLDKVKQKAIEQGLVEADEVLTREEILNLILESGLSTVASVSQIAGRGIGMDVVYSEVQNLGGELFIDTQQGKGTSFSIRLPFTMAMNRTLLVRLRDRIYALPANMVSHAVPVSNQELETIFALEKADYVWNKQTYPVAYLDTLLNNSPAVIPDPQQKMMLLIINHSGLKGAVYVDSIMGTRDSVLKPTGPQLNKVKGVSGATIMSDGNVVLILDLLALLRKAQTLEKPKLIHLKELNRSKDDTLNIIVIDDSVTVRKVTERFLRRYGVKVSTAKDGVEALEKIETLKPDAILLDIEMPRMDGLELVRKLKDTPELANTPIIMITSRTGKQHRIAAEQLGVDVFLGKPYQESDLISHIQNLTGKSLHRDNEHI